jgi:hypothetical protein
VEASPHRPGKAYVSILRYQLDDWQPYAFRTTDHGKSWTRITTGGNGIPADWPVRVVREDPSREGLLYAGTEFGLFISFDDGGQWQAFQQNLPVTPVTDIAVYRKDLSISTMGRGFWILDDLSALHQLASADAGAPARLFQPRDAFRLRYNSFQGESGDPQHPQPGLTLHYSLAQDATAPVLLDILDGEGTVLRSFSSGTAADSGAAPPGGMRTGFGGGPAASRLSNRAGLHRFRWDYTVAGPVGSGARGGRGPWVAPGVYQVRLSVGEWKATQPLRLLIDPRLRADGITEAILIEQSRMSRSIRDLVSNGFATVTRLQTLRRRAAELAAGATPAAAGAKRAGPKLAGVDARLVTAAGRYQTARLADQINFLYNTTLGADQQLGRDVYERFDELGGMLRELIAELNAIVTADLPSLKDMS